MESQHVEFWRTEFWHVEFWRMMCQESQTGVKWRISPPICARIPRGNILCAETLEMPLELKKVIYSQHVEFWHVDFWHIWVPEFHVAEIHVPKLSYAEKCPKSPLSVHAIVVVRWSSSLYAEWSWDGREAQTKWSWKYFWSWPPCQRGGGSYSPSFPWNLSPHWTQHSKSCPSPFWNPLTAPVGKHGFSVWNIKKGGRANTGNKLGKIAWE